MNSIKLYALFIIAALSFQSANAQTTVELDITNKLSGSAFAFNVAAKNDISNDFKITRLEYYISKISIKHDGGTVTEVPNHYILVNGGQNVTDDLGMYNITNVESVSFYVGVDTPINHADPSLQPTGSPLAPRTPSMHWGWAGGYRFAAFEGMAGTAFDQAFEIHALGDANYFQVTIPVSGVMQGSKIVIPINAEYTMALKGITLSSGLIVHGDNAEAATLLNNFKTSVFSPGFPVGVNKIAGNNMVVRVYPNPSFNGAVTINFENVTGAAEVKVYDIQGRVIAASSKAVNEKSVSIHVQNKGLYMMQVQAAGGERIVQKLEIL